MNPHIINLLEKGHEEKVKEMDYLAWLFGNYVFSAVRTAVEQCLAGKDAKSQYIEKPILQMVGEKEEMTEEELYEKELKEALFAEEQWIKAAKQKGLPETII